MTPLRPSAGSWAAPKVGCRRLQVVGGARCQRPRKPLDCSGRGDTAPREGREEKDARGLDNSGNIEGFFVQTMAGFGGGGKASRRGVGNHLFAAHPCPPWSLHT